MSIKYTLGRSEFRTLEEGLEKEWLLTNGIGGFASQSIIGANNRIFSGYLIASLHPPVDRMLVLAKTQEAVCIGDKEYDLTAQSYIGGNREGQKYLNRFELDVVPTYTYEVQGIQIKKSIAMEYGKNKVVICYEIRGGRKEASVNITPCFNYRPFGEVTEKSQLKFKKKLFKDIQGGSLILIPENHPDVQIEFSSSEGNYYDRSLKPVSMATPNYLIEENELYPMDVRTGFLGVDQHYTPYEIQVQVNPGEYKTFYITCKVTKVSIALDNENGDSKNGFMILREYKRRMYQLMDQVPFKDTLAKRLAWAADAFIVKRESTGLKTIMAGYPWFTDWGRDTMIALQGLTLCTGRLGDARDILESFSRYIKDGMIPNVFPGNAEEEPMYNTIDASLWYFYSVYKFLQYADTENDSQFIKDKIYPGLKEIIKAYEKGTHYGIGMDEDFLIQGGSNLDQLTWMDVRVGDWVVTPRHGKAVEINALWYNALMVMEQLAQDYEEDGSYYLSLAMKVKESFQKKFWNEEKGCLYDVISKDSKEASDLKQNEVYDDRIRPNQIFAVSLPFTMLDREKEINIVEVVREQLYTPYGLRSLSYEDKDYKPYYIGKLINRDGAYHMGTTWAYLSGAFITAFCKVNDYSHDAVMQAKEMCEYFGDHMEDGCLNGIAEIFDGDFACTSRGCYSQAWSVGEILRAYTEDVLQHL
jgi:predicted glycogen debranching enzyme